VQGPYEGNAGKGAETVAEATVLEVPGRVRKVSARLVVYYEADDGTHSQVVNLSEGAEVTFGRSRANTVAIDSNKISRNHAKVSFRSGAVLVEDLGSRNGTTLNGQKIDQPTTVSPGDEIGIGPATAMISLDTPIRTRKELHTSQFLDARLAAECDRGIRFKRPFALVMIHLHGDHEAADELVNLASGSVRPMDVVAEYSPDEIALLLPEANRQVAEASARQLADVLAEQAQTKGGKVKVRIGVACFPDDAAQPGAIIGQAKAAMRSARTGLVPVGIAEAKPVALESGDIVVADPKMKRVFELVAKVADSKMTVLLTGETGAGKEVIAEAIHQKSHREAKPYIRINCACLTETLLESELFGHERGSFTGADRRKIGYFEACDGGTLFLDEIGEMPLSLQSKLLRVLEESRFTRVGGTAEIQVDVRVVCATNRDLAQEVQAGRFREDLFFRVSAFTIVIPALRERRSEIPLLADVFIKQVSNDLDGAAPTLSPEALRLMESYNWPGNVRELRNAIERAAVLETSGRIEPEHLPDRIRDQAVSQHAVGGQTTPTDMRETIADVERASIVKALESCAGNQTRAAKQLGISRRSLIYKMEKYGLKKPPSSSS
jgi:diguanylate cyclase (GGDEF)-like protein